MQVSEAMNRTAQYVGPNEPLGDIARRMKNDGIGALPVGEDDRLIGMVTDRDIVVRGFDGADDLRSKSVRDVMSEGINWTFEDSSLEEAAEVMANRQVQRLPVINHDKRMVGVISLSDLVRCGPEGEPALKIAASGVKQPS